MPGNPTGEVRVIVLLFGPPGCGKGTQAEVLAERYHIPAISTGEMFRAECKAGTELGTRASAILAAGGLVGDDIVNGMVAGRIARGDCADGFLLDGYPRTLDQARYFSQLIEQRGLPSPIVIHLDVPDENLIARLTARRQCPQCKHIYNVLAQPPKVEGLCDRDGAVLTTREDDRETVIRDRLRAYAALTNPILRWYGASVVRRIDGGQDPARVSADIDRVLAEPSRPQMSLVYATDGDTGGLSLE